MFNHQFHLVKLSPCRKTQFCSFSFTSLEPTTWSFSGSLSGVLNSEFYRLYMYFSEYSLFLGYKKTGKKVSSLKSFLSASVRSPERSPGLLRYIVQTTSSVQYIYCSPECCPNMFLLPGEFLPAPSAHAIH